MNRTNLQQFNVLSTLLTDKLENMERDLKKYAANPKAIPAIVQEKQEIIGQLRQFLTVASETVSSEYIAGFDAGKIYTNDTKQRMYTAKTKEQYRYSHELDVKTQLSNLF